VQRRQRFTSVWAREAARRREVRGNPSGLSREQIVREAVALLDAEGADALSMRRLAARLGSGATSLYWYVANKDELLELAAEIPIRTRFEPLPLASANDALLRLREGKVDGSFVLVP